MTREVELLSPAGDFETALTAFAYGADAVYCGLQDYSARAFAKNLSIEDLHNLLRVAHAPVRTAAGGGRKVYVTFNTLVEEGEVDDAARRLAELADAGVDGVIVQDLGIARIVRENFPELELHASTQLVAHNLEGVLALKDLGFKRVVLARELSLAEVESIAKRCGVEIECFIHGALCYSLSGLCLFSAMEHGRSGNRGRCAYSCRGCYHKDGEAKAESAHPFSMKDLRLGEDVRRLALAGVKSLKIEGRMKSPLYVASVTKYYREILDGVHPRSVTEGDLETVFSRETTKLYFDGAPGEAVDGVAPGHAGTVVGKVKRITRDREGRRWLRFHTLKALEKHDGIQFAPRPDGESEEKREGFGITAMRKAISRATVFEVAAGEDVELLLPDEGFEDIKPGERVYLAMSNAVKKRFPIPSFRKSDWPGTKTLDVEITLSPKAVTARGGGAEARIEGEFGPAKNPDATRAACEKAFSRLGESEFRLGRLEVHDPDGLFVPMGVLNELRRRLAGQARPDQLHSRQPQCERAEGKREIVKRRASLKILFGADAPQGDWGETVWEIGQGLKPDEIGPACDGVRLALPVYTGESDYPALRALVKALVHRGWKRWEAADLAAVRMLKALGIEDISADWTIYAFNSLALAELEEYGVRRFVASPENSPDNLEKLARSGYDIEFLTRQWTPLFISLNEPCGGEGSYSEARGEGVRVFRKGKLFVTTRRTGRRFDAPQGANTREDLSFS